jgi:hypothetical protein
MGHAQNEDRQAENDGNAKPPHQIRQLVVSSLLARGHDWLKGHATFRAVTQDDPAGFPGASGRL